MIRPMTSNVSALSSIVANSHQAIHFVSSAPSIHPLRRENRPSGLKSGMWKRKFSELTAPHLDSTRWVGESRGAQVPKGRLKPCAVPQLLPNGKAWGKATSGRVFPSCAPAIFLGTTNATRAVNASGEPDAPAKDRLR